ncbi:hypothetical protein BDR07DRAFT_1464543 [Suillus spraguei]|nr:hypothetical protein BDR07DRAFT_1464543 [Suillus spraguei]
MPKTTGSGYYHKSIDMMGVDEKLLEDKTDTLVIMDNTERTACKTSPGLAYDVCAACVTITQVPPFTVTCKRTPLLSNYQFLASHGGVPPKNLRRTAHKSKSRIASLANYFCPCPRTLTYTSESINFGCSTILHEDLPDRIVPGFDDQATNDRIRGAKTLRVKDTSPLSSSSLDSVSFTFVSTSSGLFCLQNMSLIKTKRLVEAHFVSHDHCLMLLLLPTMTSISFRHFLESLHTVTPRADTFILSLLTPRRLKRNSGLIRYTGGEVGRVAVDEDEAMVEEEDGAVVEEDDEAVVEEEAEEAILKMEAGDVGEREIIALMFVLVELGLEEGLWIVWMMG